MCETNKQPLSYVVCVCVLRVQGARKVTHEDKREETRAVGVERPGTVTCAARIRTLTECNEEEEEKETSRGGRHHRHNQWPCKEESVRT